MEHDIERIAIFLNDRIDRAIGMYRNGEEVKEAKRRARADTDGIIELLMREIK